MPVNRRQYVRYPCRLPVEIFFSAPGMVEMVSAVARNISKGGMLIECAKSLAAAATLHLSFTIPEWMALRGRTDRNVMVEAQTRHSGPEAGVYGLQFAAPLA